MVTDFYHPFLGGVEQHVRSLSESLAARGHDVAVATLWQEGLANYEELCGIRIYRLRSTSSRFPRLFRNAARPWAPPVPDPEIVAGLSRIVRAERPEIVHGHDWLARSFLPLKRDSGARLVMSLHYYTLSCPKKNLLYFEREPCAGPGLCCLSCASAHFGALKGVPVTLAAHAMTGAERVMVDMFLPVSNVTAQGNQLTEHDENWRVLPNFVADDAPGEAGLESYLSELPEEEFILFVGDLRPAKGIDVLLEAYRRLGDAPPLVLIGKLWAESPRTLPANVRFLPQWPNRAVLAAWKRCSIAVVPSVWAEPFGIVVIEAMTCGRPVVASQVGGIPEIITHAQSGWLVPPGDAGALRNALDHLLADPQLRFRLGTGAALRALDFRASSVVPRFEQCYRELLEKSCRNSQSIPH